MHLGDPLRLNAAYYLIENLPSQYHYEGKTVEMYSDLCNTIDSVISVESELDFNHIKDSFETQFGTNKNSGLIKVDDITTIKSNFLITNIKDAFTAWNYPWAKSESGFILVI